MFHVASDQVGMERTLKRRGSNRWPYFSRRVSTPRAPRFMATETADTALDDVANFFAANSSHPDKHLAGLWAAMDDNKHQSKSRTRQSIRLALFDMRFRY